MPYDDAATDRKSAVRGPRRAVLPEPLTPKTGIGVVIDVDRVFGMEPSDLARVASHRARSIGSAARPPGSHERDTCLGARMLEIPMLY
jgi:hypothetical protein